ncbi:MAG: hypothetical protein LBS06_08250, partial [Treponema sp.]|nr:hypothetical protein [Treponema sp.]
MKKREIVSIMMAILSIGVFNACVSIEDRTMTPQERQEAEVVGTVTTNFTSFHLFHIYNKENLKNKSLGLLKEQAQKGRFTGNYDIRNIAIAGSPSAWNILLVWLLFPFDPVLFNVQKITASGDVVSYGSTSTGGTPAKKAEAGQGKLQEAVYVVCQDLIDKLPQRSAIA